jgi:hypothetical protein
MRLVRKFRYLNTARNKIVWIIPTAQNHDPGLYHRLTKDSHRKMARQAAPTIPPSCVYEKYRKKRLPLPRTTHGRQRGVQTRNNNALGNKKKR